MSTQVQYRRGTAVQVAAFTGAIGEIILDTTNWVVTIADGTTVGGQVQVGLNSTQTISNKVYNGTASTITGNITGGNLNTGAQVVATGNITTSSYFIGNGSQLVGLPAGYTNANVNTLLASWGSNTLSTTGNITVGNIVNANGNAVGNIGSATVYFNTVFAKATSAQYADLAELYTTDDISYPPGTCVAFGGLDEITQTTSYAQTNVAGVVSTNPAYIMNAGADGIPVALQGRVPCRVIGKISKGDLITSSSTAGVATRLEPEDWRPGAIIGKSLQNFDSDQEGVIEVVVGRV